MEKVPHVGGRVQLRDRLWRVLRVEPAQGVHLVEVDALDHESPRLLTVVVPPEEIAPAPPEELRFDERGFEPLGTWSAWHRILEATRLDESGLISGARFGRVAPESYQLAPTLRLLAKPRASLLVADDVGLGKTIEAGLAMLELMARGIATVRSRGGSSS